MRLIRLAATIALLIGVALSPVIAQQNMEGNIQKLQEQLKVKKRVRIIVRLSVPPSTELAAAQSQLMNSLSRVQGVQSTEPIQGLPLVVMEVEQDGLSAVAGSGQVDAVFEDTLSEPFLAQSTPLINAPKAWQNGADGAGFAIAVLDTGVDFTHGFLSGKVVRQACFSTTSAANNSTTVCPNGQSQQIGSNAGRNCPSGVKGCDHGTHVAGIAAGTSSNFSGVARKANIIAVQVFSRFNSNADCAGAGGPPCVLSFTSDQIKALQHIKSLAGSLDIASVNMSLGGGKSTTACDSNPLKPSIDELRALRIATIIASGNSGFSDGISAPACISSAISVGSTTKSDQVSGFSNSASILDLLAPGGSINASVPGGGFALKSGTSMATPQVAGAFAVVRSAKPSASVSDILAELKANGKLITDTRNNLKRPRIDLDFIGASAKGKWGFVWANDPTSASYTPSPTYAFNSSGGGVSITRSGVGQYAVTFSGLGGGGQAGGHVQVTGYGPDNNDCKVRFWSSFGTDFTASVDCYRPNGTAVDARFTTLILWP